jgi:tetratricopeptide (TPR) repeat protein
MTISVLVLAAIQVTVLRAHRKPEQNAPHSDIQARSLVAGEGGTRQRKLPGKAVVWVVVILIMLVMISPAPREIKNVAIFAPIVLLVIGAVALTKLRRWTYGLARQGEFDRAIQMDRRLARIPGYGSPLEGVILFNAGRYSEARAAVKPLAFDERGQPRLTSHELYIYALALENDGKEDEAQKLLEAAVLAPQRAASFHVSLATCLLSQKKDASRACELLEQAMATPAPPMPAYARNADHVRRLGRYAWALAAAGRRPEAETRLQEAFAGSSGIRARDLADLQVFAGEMWRSLGEWKRAREAFDEALRLSPDGSAATSAKRALAKLREEERG